MLSVSSHTSDSLGGKFQVPVMMTENNELRPLCSVVSDSLRPHGL